MSRSYRKSNRKIMRRAGICIVLMAVLMFAVYEFYEWRECRDKIYYLEEQLNLYERVVYVATEKLPKGTVLTQDKLEKQVRYSDYSPENFITENAFGLAVAQDIPEGVCLMKSMLCPAEGDVREYFLAETETPEHIQENDRIDLRIRYDNAEEYVVLSDKRILSCEPGKGLVLCLTEEEILLVSSAIADSEKYDHAKLYVVEYPEYKQVEEGRVNYIANKEVLMLLGREKTEGESRAALEQRLMQRK